MKLLDNLSFEFSDKLSKLFFLFGYPKLIYDKLAHIDKLYFRSFWIWSITEFWKDRIDDSLYYIGVYSYIQIWR